MTISSCTRFPFHLGHELPIKAGFHLCTVGAAFHGRSHSVVGVSRVVLPFYYLLYGSMTDQVGKGIRGKLDGKGGINVSIEVYSGLMRHQRGQRGVTTHVCVYDGVTERDDEMVVKIED